MVSDRLPVRTRFAPSPTGRLHVGNVRIAVFNWLFARHHGGQFVLRVEDTDVERNVPGAEEALMEDLRWLGLDWDEGPDRSGPHEPYRQSGRFERYRQVAMELMESGHAYRCYCTDEELAGDRESVAEGEVLRYSGRCRRLEDAERERFEAENRPWVVRFAVPEGMTDVEIEDEVRGSISFPASEITDFILLRTDGRPTYNFAVVADDLDMQISHVIRGAGHLSNTPRQALLFDALTGHRPAFAHLPTVLSPGGGRLSKRHGAASLDSLRDEGILPDAIVNYLSLLGWSAPDEREVLSREELVDAISLDRVGASDTVWDPGKLRWVSSQHIQGLSTAELMAALESFLPDELRSLPDDRLQWAVELLRSRLQALADIGVHNRAFLYPPDEVLQQAREEVGKDPPAVEVVASVAAALQELEAWTPESTGQTVRQAGQEVGARGRHLFHPVRKVLTGQESGPDLGLLIATLGRKEVLRRLRSAIGVDAGRGV